VPDGWTTHQLYTSQLGYIIKSFSKYSKWLTNHVKIHNNENAVKNNRNMYPVSIK
jgi:hypothetical protein